MNALQDYIILHNLGETSVMNLLQDQGIISDLCVRAEDVYYETDAVKAVEWLKRRRTTPRYNNTV